MSLLAVNVCHLFICNRLTQWSDQNSVLYVRRSKFETCMCGATGIECMGTHCWLLSRCSVACDVHIHWRSWVAHSISATCPSVTVKPLMGGRCQECVHLLCLLPPLSYFSCPAAQAFNVPLIVPVSGDIPGKRD